MLNASRLLQPAAGRGACRRLAAQQRIACTSNLTPSAEQGHCHKLEQPCSLEAAAASPTERRI